MKSFVGQKSPGRELVPTLLKLEELGLDLLYIYVSSVETFPKPGDIETHARTHAVP